MVSTSRGSIEAEGDFFVFFTVCRREYDTPHIDVKIELRLNPSASVAPDFGWRAAASPLPPRALSK